nr:RNA-directed DNA polymerase, eukaryota [Tanacetum cinerariifolium]
VSLSNSSDRWICDLTSDGVFRVKEVRNCIDDIFLPSQVIDTRWVRFVPIKVNILIWRARQDCLPTRVNLVRRSINVDSCVCPICSTGEDEINHILFRCDLAQQQVLRRICRWWELDPSDWNTFQEWYAWFSSIRFSSKSYSLLEGTFFVAWWNIWRIRNHIIFEGVLPRRSEQILRPTKSIQNINQYEDSDDAISNDEGDKNQNSNIFGDDDDAEDGREHQVNEDPIEKGEAKEARAVTPTLLVFLI